MAVTSDSFSGVDLSRLPSPGIIETLDFETILASNLAQFQTLFTAFDATSESDPIVKIIQLFSYREMVFRQRVNDAGHAVMVAYALDSDLDQLAALMGVERYIITPADPTTGADAVLESNEDFRRRLVLAPEGFSVAGPEGAYIYHALSASSDVLDASATSPTSDDIKAKVIALLEQHAVDAGVINAMQAMLDAAVWPGTVIATVLSRTGDGTAPQATLDAVSSKLSDTSIRPLTDAVQVQSAEIVPYAIDATLLFFSGPDRSIVLATARTQIATLIANAKRLGRDVTRAAIIAALCPEGVQNVILRSPAEDIPISRLQAGNCTGVNILDGGVAE